MTNKDGLILMNIDEFEKWLASQSVNRNITRIQEHHTYSPSYSNFKGDNHIALQTSMRNYHKSVGFGDIAQHFTTYPDGMICTGRSLNVNPCGISYANLGSICIENLGNFDKNKDVMTDEQKTTIIKMAYLLCKKFKLTPSNSTIVYHAWYTSKGINLGTYNSEKSCKTCPGTNFFGGNDIDSFNNNFLPLVKSCGNKTTTTNTTTKSITSSTLSKKDIVKNLQAALNKSYNCELVVDGIIGDKTKSVLKSKLVKNYTQNEYAKWIQNRLKIKGYSLTVDGKFGKDSESKLKSFQSKNGLTADGICGYNTAMKLI